LSDNNINIHTGKAKADIERRDDFLANRMMALLIAVTAVIVMLLLLKKNNIHFEAQFIIYALPFFQIGLGLAFISSLIYHIIRKKRKIDDSKKFFGSSMLLGSAALLSGISLAFTYLLVTGTVICLIAAVMLYFIYCFYQRDFFWFSVITAAGTVFLYTGSLDPTAVPLKNIIKTAAKGSAVLLPLIFIAAILILRRADGHIMLNGKKTKIMRKEYRYYPFITAAVITFAGSAAVLFIPGIMIYSIILLLAAYLLIAIIYTIKMM